eukprot:TRINITY_DN123950_c0_g1_i1.p2 TRINITY_DN123950_c0_g1~~TRINITY_DN123950_c0_g1_i1.p2  ORF type:complete len:306 (+),score=101.12 TRINITY_DN123950_c0_g1_i1:133-1050(+)
MATNGSAAAAGGHDFTYVLIPADESQPPRELTAKAVSFGDTLTELLKKEFAGGALTNMDALRAEYGSKIDDKMGEFQTVANRGTVEVLALVKPSKTNLPHPMTGTYLYMDEMGALKERPDNRRASQVAKQCGLDLEHPLPGDVYIGRVAIEPNMQSVSFGAHELDSSSPWLQQAPAENAVFNEAMKDFNSAMKEKQVGAKTAEEEEAEEDARGWRWTQTESELEVTVAVPAGTSSKGVSVVITRTGLKVALKGVDAKTLLDVKLHAAVRPDESTWTMGSDKKGPHVQITVEKEDEHTWSKLEAKQ